MAQTMEDLAWASKNGSYACYDSMIEDIALANCGRSISDKGEWVFEGLQNIADERRNSGDKIGAEGIEEVIQFYEENGLR
jgi:hypothetical protein